MKDVGPLERYFGIVKATVYPPRGLLDPVLPYRFGGELLLPLCRTCTEQQNQNTPCAHDDMERVLSGCWVSIELLKAVEKGYVVATIDEIWHFSETSEDLFSNYVKTFLQFKQEASGYPSHVTSETEKLEYIEDYFDKEGIRLRSDKICINYARRNINKLLLNSLWGRFSMRENLSITEVLKDPEQFARFIFGNEYDICHFSFVSDDMALVQWRFVEGCGFQTSNINVFLGAFTTAHARLELYNVMDKLGERLLYSDTDSLIFVSKDGDWEPSLGGYLGDLTDECDSGDHIIEFLFRGT